MSERETESEGGALIVVLVVLLVILRALFEAADQSK